MKIFKILTFIDIIIIICCFFIFYFLYKINLNKKDNIDLVSVRLLAGIINAEAGDNDEDMYLVGSCVLNRVDHINFPDSILNVIFEKNQFHGINSSKFEPTKKTMEISKKLLQGCNRNYDVLFFIRKDLTFDFEKKLKIIKTTNYHKFYKYKKKQL
jgi:N-acetylmuramoyl-L-alanine amidase